MKPTGLFLLVCSIFIFTMSFSFFKRNYVDMADDITRKVVKEKIKKYNMKLIGEGGGMMNCVRTVALDFQINRILTKDEARFIIVDCIEDLLKGFNENNEIRPYLQNYPFTLKNLSVCIYIVTPQYGNVYYPNIFITDVHQADWITYKTKKMGIDQWGEEKESYQEALEKVKNPNHCISSYQNSARAENSIETITNTTSTNNSAENSTERNFIKNSALNALNKYTNNQ